MYQRLLLLPLILFAWSLTARAGDDLDFTNLDYLVVQKDGRKKPIGTVAGEALQEMTGKRRFTDPDSGRSMSSMDVLVSLWLHSREWENVPIILLNHRPLKEHLGLAIEQKYFTYRDLVIPAYRDLIEVIIAKQRTNEPLTRLEREASALDERLRVLAGVLGPGTLAVIPHPSDPVGQWLPITQVATYYGEAKEEEVMEAYRGFAIAYGQRDPAAFSTAARSLWQTLAALSPSVYPSPDDVRPEVHYNAFHPFRKAAWLYGIAFVWLLITWQIRRGAIYWGGLGLMTAGVAVHTYAFILRILISGRPPITNMYESVVWVSFGAALFALIMELIYRQRYFVVSVAPLAMLLLLMADQLPAVLDPSIGPLVPVLRDNFWLTVHVPCITLSYAAMLVAMGVGHVALGCYIFRPSARPLIGRLENYIYRSMQVGVVLLAAGTILGGIWAHYAWGRFWGWDPKETWALIALVCYLIPLHGRMSGWMTNFALSVASVLSFMAILMAWYGVNFILGQGLHSYGFGVGGTGYVAAFVAVEVAFVLVAAGRRRFAQA